MPVANEQQIRELAEFAERRADEHLATALSWTATAGPESAKDDLIKAGALYRARDVLREKRG